MQLRDRTALTKIILEVNRALEFIGDTSSEDFLNDDIMKHAIAMVVIKIGELVKNLSTEFRAENSQIPWKDIAGFRDVAAHRYEVIRMDDLYDTVREDFPALKSQIEQILEADES